MNRTIAVGIGGIALGGFLTLGSIPATASTPANPPPHSAHTLIAKSAQSLPPLVRICLATPCPDLQEFEVFDGNGWPIFSVGEAGGAGVFGDNFTIAVYRGPKDPFHPVVQLRDNGTILVGGQVLTPADLVWIHKAERIRPTW